MFSTTGRTSREEEPKVSRRSAPEVLRDKPVRSAPAVQVDVDSLETQLAAFRATKKAQLLATNKDIHKRTFL